jgi:Uncharacterized conserved protein
MIWIGTSGFQYDEWKGTFYPATLSKAKMLSYYAGHFSTTEVNYSFRRIPSLTTIEKWNRETPSMFQFTFKAPQEITHFRKLRDCGPILNAFADVIQTLDQKLGVVLFQLPPTFERDDVVLGEFLNNIPKGLKSAFEFRHKSWLSDDTFSQLEKAGAAVCIADTEDLSTPVVFTAPYSYFRLRRTDYKKADIERWAKVIQERQSTDGDAYVYFKHEEAGVGPQFGKQLQQLLGVEPAPAPSKKSQLNLFPSS